MVVVRHRSASGRLDDLWEYDPARRVVELVMRLGSASPLNFTVRVCSPDRPRINSHPLLRLDADSWRLVPAHFIEQEVGAIEIGGVPFPVPRPTVLEPRDCRPLWREHESPCGLHRTIGSGTTLVLANTPSHVELELLELSA